MRRMFRFESGLCLVVTLLGGALPLAAVPTAPEAATQLSGSEVYGKLPLSFEANEGQVDKAVKFLCRGQRYALFLTPTEAVLSLSRPPHETAVVGLQLAGGNGNPRLVGVDAQATTSNYFIGNDPRQWHTGVAHYARVRVEGVYPGVDLIYRGNQRQLEYDFVVAPGADPGRIRLAFRGADLIRIGAQGELILHTATGDLVQPAPTLYQEAGERLQRVEGHYVLLHPLSGKRGGEGVRRQVGFVVGRYDRTRPLVIDPVLVYSTFLGGSGRDGAKSIALDGAGNAYVAGYTESTTFPSVSGSSIQPASGGAGDAFVTKINAAGTAIVYSTFLGGSELDAALGIAVDGAGNAYVTGHTTSTTFPGVSGSSIQRASGGDGDAFVTKINATGTAILYSTFLGGSGEDVALGIAVDGANNAYVTGFTTSTTFPGVSGSSIQPAPGSGNGSGRDAFVTKINAAGTAIVYSTFLGGSNDDVATGIAVDGTGNAYVTGVTASKTFPGVNPGSIQPANAGIYSAFVTKINAAGTATVYSTFLNGSSVDSVDMAVGIAIDGAGAAYVTGATSSATFTGVTANSIQHVNRSTSGSFFDAFVTKINPAGSATVYSTFLGGPGNDYGTGIAVDGAGNAHVTGFTDSTAFTGVNASSIQPANGGGKDDAFVTEINAAGTAIVYSTFLGGSASDAALGIAVDGAGNAYVTGATNSATFPGVNVNSIQPLNAGGPGGGGFYGGMFFMDQGPDAFVTKIGNLPCVASGTTLCLDDHAGDRRWQVTASFSTTQGGGRSGSGQAIPLASLGVSHGGLLWFFGADNPEVLFKVLNACALNQRFWVFYSATTNVGFTITVKDTTTGLSKSYQNKDRTAAPPILDTSAFTCTGGDADRASGDGERAAVLALQRELAMSAKSGSSRQLPPEPGAVAGCAANATTLCIDGRFQIQTSFQTAQGGGSSGAGQAIALQSLGVAQGGLFWFFSAGNPEMLVKVLDGCALNHKFWVFYAAGTNVGFTVTVTDTVNGHQATYRNPDKTPALPIQDTSALPCP